MTNRFKGDGKEEGETNRSENIQIWEGSDGGGGYNSDSMFGCLDGTLFCFPASQASKLNFPSENPDGNEEKV